MTDCFYINGACAPEGNKTLTKPILRTVKGKNHVFAVADSSFVSEDTPSPSHTLCTLLKKYNDKLSEANVEQLDYVMRDLATDLNGEMRALSSSAGYNDFSSSFSLLTVNGGVATVTTVGSTSAFLLRDGEMTPLSPEGAKVPSKAKHQGKLIGGYQGGDIITPDLSDSYEITKNDLFLLCSDGLCSVLSKERISYILSLDLSDERIATRLVTEALAGGCNDDITVMLIRNGGQPYASHKRKKKILPLVMAVVIVAVLFAWMMTGIRSCSRKPDIAHEGENISESQTPKPTEFMTTNPEPTDDYILRE